MRQIPSQVGFAVAGGGQAPVMTAYVPANSWGIGKLLLIRGIYQLILPGVGSPPTYDIAEFVSVTGATSYVLPTPPAFVPSPGVYTTERVFNAIRIDPAIEILDFGDNMQHAWLNQFDNIEHAYPLAAIAPPFDFSNEIVVSMDALLPGSFAGAQVTCLWCEAFLEQSINLGTLS